MSSSDVGRKLRFNVTARNSLGIVDGHLHRVRRRDRAAPVGRDPPPERRDLDPGGKRAVQSAPDRLAGALLAEPGYGAANDVITVRVRTKDTRGFVVRDALVFVRSTPRVTTGGDRQVTTTDGWVTYQLAPNGNFPQPRNGFNVQFFVKAYRSGDPGLAGIAGYRLVQVRLAG